MFEAVSRRTTRVELCAQQIREAILAGELAVGARLPPERRLAETFGVNRVTVRAALARLADAGLLSVRQGSGHVVRDYRRSGGPDLLPGLVGLARADGDVRPLATDLLRMRRHMARAVLEALAERNDPDAIETVRIAVARFAEVVASGASTADVATADLEVLAAILDATGSAALGLCLNPVLAVLGELPELRDAIYAEPEQNVTAYAVLVEWLTTPGPETIGPLFDVLAARDEATIARLAP